MKIANANAAILADVVLPRAMALKTHINNLQQHITFKQDLEDTKIGSQMEIDLKPSRAISVTLP